MASFPPPSDFYGPDRPLPVWEEASDRIQAGYVAVPSDCATVAVRILIVLKNIKPGFCLTNITEPAIIHYVNNLLREFANEQLVKTWNRVGIFTYETRVFMGITRLYTRKSGGFLIFRQPDITAEGHIVSFLYNFGLDTLDFFHKDQRTGKIVYTSIGADNQREAIIRLIFNLFGSFSGLILDGIYETQPIAGGSKNKGRKYSLPKLRGGIAPDRKAYFDLVKQSYEPSASKLVGNWELVAETPTLKFYKSGNDVVVSIRGTFDSRDTKADATIAVNSLHLSDRFKEDERFLNEFKQQNPDLKYYGVGHSLGGAILDLFLHKGLITEGQSYNPAIQPHDFGAILPNHRIFMDGDPLYTLVRLFLKQKPEVIKENSSIFRKIARLTPIGNIATAGEYLKSHGLDQFEGKGKLSKLNEALSKKKIMESTLIDDQKELEELTSNLDWIDPEDDVEFEIAEEEIRALRRKIRNLRTALEKINGKIRNYYEDGTHNPVHVRPTAKPLPGPSRLRNGQGKSGLTLHAVIVKKPYDLQEARAVARDIMKSKKDKFMRETSTSYRFRNVPKTKFSSFVTKVLNPQVSLVFGKLK